MECLGNIRQQNDGLLGVEAVTTTWNTYSWQGLVTQKS